MNHHQANELLPCPFCGGKANVVGAYNAWSVNCSQCDAYSSSVGSKEASVAAWNRRAAPTSEPLTTAQLEMIEEEVQRRTTDIVKSMNRADPDMDDFFNDVVGPRGTQAPTEPAVDRDALILVRAAAKDMYNKTFAEKRLRLSSYFSEVRDAAVAAGEVFVAAVKATEHLAAFAAPAVPAAPLVASEHDRVMEALTEARSMAMRNAIDARIPECGNFATIAQNLDWAITTMQSSGITGELPQAAPPSPSVDQAKRLVAGGVAAAMPDILFDGMAVYEEITRMVGKGHCISTEAVAATLDAVVRMIRADRASTGSATSTDTKESA